MIGLTGGIAAGKSSVADELRALGAGVVDADLVSRQLVAGGSPLLAELAAEWGSGILRADGTLDRPALAARVFGKPQEVARLNAITHPPIMREMERQVRSAPQKVVVLMAPLLIEAGGSSVVDETWVVTAPLDLRLRRIAARDGLSDEAARARAAAQLDESARLRRADVVIQNEGDVETLRQHIQDAWDALQKRVAQAGESS